MQAIEIVTIIICIAIVGGVLGKYIYRRIHHLPTGECASCNKGKKLIDQYHRDYGKKKCCKNKMN